MRPKYSLRALLVLLLVTSCWAAWQGAALRREKTRLALIEKIQQRGGQVHTLGPDKRCSVKLVGLALTKQDLEELSKLEFNGHKLVGLDLGHTKIGDSELASVARFRNLEDLGLGGTKVTSPAVQSFQRKNPDCAVHWSGLVAK